MFRTCISFLSNPLAWQGSRFWSFIRGHKLGFQLPTVLSDPRHMENGLQGLGAFGSWCGIDGTMPETFLPIPSSQSMKLKANFDRYQEGSKILGWQFSETIKMETSKELCCCDTYNQL